MPASGSGAISIRDLIAKDETGILNDWIEQQLAASTLRRDLMSDAELREESRRFLSSVRGALEATDGNVDPASEPPHAFRYRDGVMHDAGTGFGAGSFSRAWDIADNGTIVGERSRTQSSPVRAFLAGNGRFRDLGTLGGSSPIPFSVESIAYAINPHAAAVIRKALVAGPEG